MLPTYFSITSLEKIITIALNFTPVDLNITLRAKKLTLLHCSRVRKNSVEPLAEEAGGDAGETSLLAGLTTEQVLSTSVFLARLLNSRLYKMIQDDTR